MIMANIEVDANGRPYDTIGSDTSSDGASSDTSGSGSSSRGSASGSDGSEYGNEFISLSGVPFPSDSDRGTTTFDTTEIDFGSGSGSGGIGTAGRRKPGRSRKSANREDFETPEVVVEVGRSPKQATFHDPDDKPKATRRSSSKIASADVGSLLCGLFAMYAVTRPVWVRQAWDYSPNEVMGVAEPLTRILNRLPTKYVALTQNLIDPVTLLMGITTLINHSQTQERLLNHAFQTQMAQQNRATNESGGVFGQFNASQNGDSSGANGGNEERRNTDPGYYPRNPDVPIT